MKDGKAKTAKKRTTSSSAKPKVRDVKARSVDKDFKDVDEGNDNRLIVFVAIAILIILATIIGLLVGCEKKKEKEPEKPIDEIVVPEKEDKDDGVVTREIVRKVKSTYTAKKKTTTTSTPTYTVTIYFNDEPITQDVKKGDTIDDEAPKGYNSCVYYTNEDMTEEFDPSTAITGETNLFMTCEVTVYTVTYDPETSSNPGTYTIEDNDTTLDPASGDNFIGWFAEDGTEVKTLNSGVIDLADGERVIKLTAKFGEVTGETSDDETEETTDDTDAVTTNMVDGNLTEDGTSELDGEPAGGRRALVLEEPAEEEEVPETLEPKEEEKKEDEDKIVTDEVEDEDDEEENLTPPETTEPDEKKDDEDKKEVTNEPEVKEVEEEEKKPEEPKVEEKPIEPKVEEKVPEVKEPKVETPKPVETPVVDTEPTIDE